MKTILSTLSVIILSLLATSCEETQSTSTYDITGVWVNVGDENDIFTFNADKTGSYTYSYLTETNPDDPYERYESSAYFDLYLVETMEDGGYSLSFFADTDFPIYNATFTIVEGYLKISYDWSDMEGHVKDGVLEAYRKIE